MNRYAIETNEGKKITWAENKSEAIAKAEAKGFKVIGIKIEDVLSVRHNRVQP